MTITLNLPSDLASQLQAAALREGMDIASLLLDSARQRVRRDVLPERDEELLEIIAAPVAVDSRAQRDRLIQLQETRPLSDSEMNELETLIDAVEMANARRWRCVAELAVRRGQTIDAMAHDLEIPLP